MASGKILVVGAAGQIGIDLVLALRKEFGDSQVVASDIRIPDNAEVAESGPFVHLNILNEDDLIKTVKDHEIDTIYHLAAMLSANAEKSPDRAWDLNMRSLFNTLDLAREKHIKRLFWPSSIAVFGPTTPNVNTPQITVTEPTTVYGISKLAGERWCDYYFRKYGVDVRSVRYPGLIGHRSLPGGGTTDYAVDIYYKAVADEHFSCFLKEDTRLPMMYMDDAIRATISITETAADNVHIRSSYNLAGISFTPEELVSSIQKTKPGFTASYEPDFRQQIADSWPESIDDSAAQSDWDWKNRFDIDSMSSEMLTALEKKNQSEVTL